MAPDALSERIASVFEREIRRLVDEIASIDARLAELGDSEEDEIERTLLSALRRHLINDLRELGGFSGDPFLFEVALEESLAARPAARASGEAEIAH